MHFLVIAKLKRRNILFYSSKELLSDEVKNKGKDKNIILKIKR